MEFETALAVEEQRLKNKKSVEQWIEGRFLKLFKFS
jgi:hypothetical protein